MYFNNAFGGGSGGATALTSPPNSLASLLNRQQAQGARQPLGGPQIPQAGQQSGMMTGQSNGANLSRPNAAGPSGATATPQSTDLMKLLGGMDKGKATSLLQSLGLGDLASGTGGGSGSPLLFDLGKSLGLDGLFGGGSSFTHGDDGLPGFTGGGPSLFNYGNYDFGS